jgi:hypothetical protein
VKAQTLKKLDSAERAVHHLVAHCCKEGRLYRHNPKLVAQVSRTGKWLLNAMAALRQALPCTKETNREFD